MDAQKFGSFVTSCRKEKNTPSVLQADVYCSDLLFDDTAGYSNQPVFACRDQWSIPCY